MDIWLRIFTKSRRNFPRWFETRLLRGDGVVASRPFYTVQWYFPRHTLLILPANSIEISCTVNDFSYRLAFPRGYAKRKKQKSKNGKKEEIHSISLVIFLGDSFTSCSSVKPPCGCACIWSGNYCYPWNCHYRNSTHFPIFWWIFSSDRVTCPTSVV